MGRLLPVKLALLLVVCGCSLTPQVPLKGDDSSRYRQIFKEMAVAQHYCRNSGDAEVTVTVDSPWQTGTISGYLQTMSPSFLKFVGMTPFGQPLVVLATDGDKFSYSVISEGKGFEGKVASKTFKRYAPSGFDPETSFYWLIGRLPPGSVDIIRTSGDRDERGVWIRLRYEEGTDSLVLFDPARKVILQHSKLDGNGNPVLDVKYDRYQSGECSLPGQITVSSRNHHGSLVVDLQNWQMDTLFLEGEFEFDWPSGFKKVEVQ